MGYAYGDKRTAGNGVWLWLQGNRNRNETADTPNYIPRKLDINQKGKFVRELVFKFMQQQGIECTQKQVNKNTEKYYRLIQKQFHQFVKFVKENYEPQ